MGKIRIFHYLFIFLFLYTVSCSSKPATKPSEIFDPEKAFAKANEQFEKSNFDKAREAFYEVKNRDLSKKYAPFAQLRIADSYVREEEPDRAVAEYKKFIEEYPDHKYASYAQYQIAMVYFNQIESPERGYSEAAKALEEFEKLKKMFPRNPYKDVVEARIAKCKTIIAEYEFLVGEFYYKKESYQAAITRFEELLKKFPGYKREADALFYTGISYKKLGMKDKASEYLTRLIEKYPDSKKAKDAKKELGSLGK